MYRVVVSDDRFDEDYSPEQVVLERVGAELIHAYRYSRDQLMEECRRADAILVNQMPVDGSLINSLDRCRVISRYGTGYEKVDVAAATEKGIWVARVPDYCYDEVAEHTLALLLASVRQVAQVDRRVRSGQWNIHATLSLPRIKGMVLGILGYGGTGRSFHRKAEGLGFSRVLICDHHADTHNVAAGEAEIVDLDVLLREADIISLHIPMRESNRGLINDKAFHKMKHGSVLINTARGGIIEEAALLQALSSGKLRAAGLDVFDTEPLPGDSPLLNHPSVVISDHNAYYSETSITELKRKCAENVAAVLTGGVPNVFVEDIREK